MATMSRCAFVGEGGQIRRDMEELLEHLMRWNLHPDRILRHRYSLGHADEAYRVADQGAAGKVCIVFA